MRRASVVVLGLALGLGVVGCDSKKAEEPKNVAPPPKEPPKGANVPGGGPASGAGSNTGTPGEKAPTAMP